MRLHISQRHSCYERESERVTVDILVEVMLN